MKPGQSPTEVLRVKSRVRLRDDLRCVKCGMANDDHIEQTGRQLDVHRRTPGSLYRDDDCETLCRSCHGPEPKRERGTIDLSHRGPVNRPVLYPEEWLEIAHRRAGKAHQPTVWYLIELIRRDAEADGETGLPALPWERTPKK